MSILEKARTRVEELKGRGFAKGEVFPKLREIRAGGKILGQLPTIDQIQQKGLIGVIEETFPRIRDIRSKRLFGAVTPTSQKPGIVEDIYIEPLKGERGRDLSVQM